MPERLKPPSWSWKAFLDNQVKDLVSIDFFTVPTATFRVLFVLVVLAHHCRRLVRFKVTVESDRFLDRAADAGNVSPRIGYRVLCSETGTRSIESIFVARSGV